MADVIYWIDGFDNCASTQLTRKGYAGNPSGNGTGRFGGRSITFTGTTNVEKIITATSAVRIGFSFKINSHGGSAQRIVRVRESSTELVDLGLSATRQLRLTRNNTQIGVSTEVLTVGSWHHVEWYVVVNASIGNNQCVVRLDNIEVINLAATSNTGTGTPDRVSIVGAGGNNYEMDDYVISTMDVTTSPAFLGDMRVLTLYPNADGNYSQFDGSDGNSVNNYQLVDETLTIDDADYVTSDVVGERDSYNVENLTLTPTSIAAAQISCSMRKDDAGAKTARLFYRINGTDYDSADINPITSFNSERYIAELNPDTGVAWTASDINNLEIGVKVQA